MFFVVLGIVLSFGLVAALVYILIVRREMRTRTVYLCCVLYDVQEQIRLTQEYVGDGLLPALPGWSWYDAIKLIDYVLSEYEDEF